MALDGYSALDRLDLRILAILQADGRITNQALAEKVAEDRAEVLLDEVLAS